MASVVGWLFVEIGGSLTGRLQREECRHMAALLAHAGAEPIASADTEALDKLARQFISTDSLHFVTFFDADGRVVASAGMNAAEKFELAGDIATLAPGATLGTPHFVPATAETRPHLDITYPINRRLAGQSPADDGASPEAPRRELLGYVRVGLSVEQSIKELASSMDLVTGLAIFVVILTVPLGFLIVRGIVEPVNDLAVTMETFAAGDLSARSRVRRGDEIGKLAQAFNRMADLHERNHAQLVSLNAELEERVQHRTRQLHELAARDPLTGLYNRRHLGEVLANRFHEARRYRTPLSCLMVDLDDFKKVNDMFGHHAGDQLLVLTAQTIAGQLRASDVAARYGGDEFVVLLPQTTIRRAQMLSARISEKLSDALREELPHVRLSMSIGVSGLAEVDSDDPDALLRAADRALYAAKSEGKARVVTAAPVAV